MLMSEERYSTMTLQGCKPRPLNLESVQCTKYKATASPTWSAAQTVKGSGQTISHRTK